MLETLSIRCTPPHKRLPALRAYVLGERLLDCEAMVEGVELMRLARQLAPELDNLEWPTWADLLYQKLESGMVPVQWPPLLARQEYDPATQQTRKPMDVVKEGAIITAQLNQSALVEAVAGALRANNYAVVDGFLGCAGFGEVTSALEDAWRDGILEHQGQYLGTDHTAWADRCNDLRWNALSGLQTEANELVGALRRTAPELSGDPSDANVTCQCPLVCRYSAGAELARHSDNPARENKRCACSTGTLGFQVDTTKTDAGRAVMYSLMDQL
jgi:hypothetical protein